MTTARIIGGEAAIHEQLHQTWQTICFETDSGIEIDEKRQILQDQRGDEKGHQVVVYVHPKLQRHVHSMVD